MVNSNPLTCEDEVNLLGVTFDFELKFHSHLSNICKKASRQLNVLKRIGKYMIMCILGKLNIYFIYSSCLISITVLSPCISVMKLILTNLKSSMRERSASYMMTISQVMTPCFKGQSYQC